MKKLCLLACLAIIVAAPASAFPNQKCLLCGCCIGHVAW